MERKMEFEPKVLSLARRCSVAEPLPLDLLVDVLVGKERFELSRARPT
jgi:hypothetical protein